MSCVSVRKIPLNVILFVRRSNDDHLVGLRIEVVVGGGVVGLSVQYGREMSWTVWAGGAGNMVLVAPVFLACLRCL